MAGDNNDPKSNFVVLYLLIVLLGLTLAVTIFVFSHSAEMFPVYAPVQAAAGPPLYGYDHVEKKSTGKLPVRYANVPMSGDVTLSPAPAKDGGYDMTLLATTNSGAPFTPTSFTVNVHPAGKTDDDGMSPVFNKTATGVYTAHVKFPAAGQWDVHVKLHNDNDQGQNIYEFTQTVTVK